MGNRIWISHEPGFPASNEARDFAIPDLHPRDRGMIKCAQLYEQPSRWHLSCRWHWESRVWFRLP